MSERPSAERLPKYRATVNAVSSETKRSYGAQIATDLLAELDAVARERDELDGKYGLAFTACVQQKERAEKAERERDEARRTAADYYSAMRGAHGREVTDDMVVRFAATYGPRWFGEDWPLPFDIAQMFCKEVRTALTAALGGGA